MKIYRRLAVAAVATAALAGALPAAQAAYPDRALRIIVPFSPGGAADTCSTTLR